MNTLRMKLVFRLGEVGFSISIAETVKILEALPDSLDRENADPQQFLLGEMVHRDELIQVCDLRRRMQLSADGRKGTAAVLVLGGEDGCFGLFADRIDGIFPEDEFATFTLPFQFVDGAGPAYEKIEIWHDEPLVALDVQTLAASWGSQ